MPTSVSLVNKTVVSEVCDLNTSPPVPLGGSEHAQRQLYRALRYHTLQDPQLHNTLKDMLASVRTAGKGLSTAARLYLARREFTLGLRWSLNISCDFAAKPKQQNTNSTHFFSMSCVKFSFLLLRRSLAWFIKTKGLIYLMCYTETSKRPMKGAVVVLYCLFRDLIH